MQSQFSKALSPIFLFSYSVFSFPRLYLTRSWHKQVVVGATPGGSSPENGGWSGERAAMTRAICMANLWWPRHERKRIEWIEWLSLLFSISFVFLFPPSPHLHCLWPRGNLFVFSPLTFRWQQLYLWPLTKEAAMACTWCPFWAGILI